MIARPSLLALSVLIFSSPTLSADSSWDVLIFAQAWPKSVCLTWKEESGQECTMRNLDGWTIHGIWPNAVGTTGPTFCKSSDEFNKDVIKDLVPELQKKWNNKKGKEEDFWKYQWDKHGKCAPSFTLEKYFSQALEWSRTYNPENILKTGGIVPSPDKHYTVEEVFQTIKSQLKVVPIIKCSTVEGEKYLDEVRLCFNKELKLVNCYPKDPPSAPYTVMCSNEDKILYAPSNSPVLYCSMTNTIVILLMTLFIFYRNYC